MTAIRVGWEFAPAKINLYLRITGRLSSGYHALDTGFAFLDWGDELVAAPASNWRFSVSGPFADKAPMTADNLVVRAAMALAERAPQALPMAVQLTKNIPVAAGLGGGSADAAATLRLLARLWDLAEPIEAFADIAALLGADVPACLTCQPVRGVGRGDVLTPLPLPTGALESPPWLVLVNPGVPCATAAVFAAFSSVFSPSLSAQALDAVAKRDPWLGSLGNDLTDAACQVAPEIASALTALRTHPGLFGARLSGSGATCFAFAASAQEAHQAARSLRAHNADWWTLAAPFSPETFDT